MQVGKMVLVCTSLTLLVGCAASMDKLEQVGKPPAISEIKDPTTRPDYKPLSWPTPETLPTKQHANSLWQPGARAFFRDQRAARVGDILRVKIEIQDKAELDNQTDRNRKAKEAVEAPSIYGLEGKLGTLTPGTPDPDSLFDISNNTQSQGDGKIKRQERIETTVAALVTQVLPNGNLVVEGKQEIRINFEIREIAVSGVVRPEDIRADNSVDSTQIAEARIIYGGRGQITDVQQPRWGQQVIDILSPF